MELYLTRGVFDWKTGETPETVLRSCVRRTTMFISLNIKYLLIILHSTDAAKCCILFFTYISHSAPGISVGSQFVPHQVLTTELSNKQVKVCLVQQYKCQVVFCLFFFFVFFVKQVITCQYKLAWVWCQAICHRCLKSYLFKHLWQQGPFSYRQLVTRVRQAQRLG